MNFPIMPPQASEFAQKYDALFWVISGLTVIFTLMVAVLIIVLAGKYKRGSNADRSNPSSHNTKLEILLMGVPTILGMVIFVWSAVLFIEARTMPKEAQEIFVIGKRWMWHAQHMNGIRENNEITVPLGTPVKLTMISQDVVHAMYLPDFRAQYHVVPGRYTQLHFTATKPGTYKMFCAIHCGTQHSEMVGYVHVLPQAEFDAWMANGGNRYAKTNLTMAEAGKQIWDDKGCGNCHQTLDNERAPSVVGIYGSTRKLADGTTAVANEDYLRESILRPWNRLTEGYERTMQAYDGVLSEEQVLNLVAYMKSLGQGGTSPVKGEYEQPVKTGRDFPVGRKDSVDIANERASGGASQAHDLRNNP